MAMLIWDITSHCNLNCIHCYNTEKYDGTRKDIGRELNIEEACKVINKLYKGGFKELLLYPNKTGLQKRSQMSEVRCQILSSVLCPLIYCKPNLFRYNRRRAISLSKGIKIDRICERERINGINNYKWNAP